jgi:diphosphomevalonate decarboxylase
MKWSAKAPANIALIKYMGKAPGNQNMPLNASLSYTLPHLLTHVELEKHAKQDNWAPLTLDKNKPAHVFSAAAQERFLKHLNLIKQHFNYTGYFTVRSANNFPHGTGLASSASSFSALTQAAVQACTAATNTPIPSIEAQAGLSRLGSGSSCRSFFEPWALWDQDRVSPIMLPYPELMHQVVLVHTTEKKISSSEAHRRVACLPDYPARQIRAEKNLTALLDAFQTQDWTAAYQICWREFEDMHALFSSSSPSFSYITQETQTILNMLSKHWEDHGDGPLVTMDAGPNIHLLYRPEQTQLAAIFKQKFLEKQLDVL